VAISRDSLLAVLGGVTIGIRCAERLTHNEMWISELVTNLVARLYPRVSISGPVEHCESLAKLAKAINPNIEFVSASPPQTSIGLSVSAKEASIFPWASGWIAAVRHSPASAEGPDNPYASAAAACLAGAELFRRIFVGSTAEPDIQVSLLDFGLDSGRDRALEQLTINEVLFVGVGAVGNAALWALSRDPGLKGSIVLLDHENVALSNLQRYVLAKSDDEHRLKVAVAEREFVTSSLKPKPVSLTLEQYVRSRGDDRLPLIAISVDNVEGRRYAQALLPRLIVNGWTGFQSLGASWHVFSSDTACLACLYHPHGKGMSITEQAAKAFGLSIDRTNQLWMGGLPLSEADLKVVASTLGIKERDLGPWRGKPISEVYRDVVCGAIALDVGGVGKVETVPLAHQSALAGALLASELVKRSSPDLTALAQGEPLVAWDNVMKGPPKLCAKQRPREPGCICGDPDYQGVYAETWTAR
jgi:hypothetical protein